MKRWRRWLIGVVAFAVVALVVAACHYGFLHHQATAHLQDELAAMDRDDPGWRLADIEAARDPVPDEENGALRVAAAASLLPKKWDEKESWRILFEQAPPYLLSEEQLASLRSDLEPLRPALVEARKLAAYPRGRYPVVYKRNFIETLLPHLQPARGTAALLHYDALFNAQTGNWKGALVSSRAAINTGRSIDDEPDAVAQLVRSACVTMGCKGVEGTLALGEPDAEDLAGLQQILEEEDGHSGYLITVRGERALLHELLDAVESGEVSFSEVCDGHQPDWQARLFAGTIQDGVRDEHARLFSVLNPMVEDARLPPHLWGQRFQQYDADVRAQPPGLMRLLLPALDRMAETCRREHAQVRCLAAALAAERYRRLHGDWPPSLDPLTPGLLAAVPLDPYDGEPLRYRRQPDGVVVYSVGPDGVDDGGSLTPDRAMARPAPDIGFRLWDPDKRRQPPKPPDER